MSPILSLSKASYEPKQGLSCNIIHRDAVLFWLLLCLAAKLTGT